MRGRLASAIVRPNGRVAAAAAVVALAVLAGAVESVRETCWFVVRNLAEVSPLVVPGIIVAGWVSASGAGDRIAGRFTGNTLVMIVAAAAIGAITPVCGVTVLPLMATLLASGVPLAAVMAFWLSSPITDPAMLATTAAMLGWEFAIGKTVAAFGLGLLGGIATWCVGVNSWTSNPLRSNRIVGNLGQAPVCGADGFRSRIWNDRARLVRFRQEVIAIARLILICLIPAFVAEYLLHALLEPQALLAYVGDESPWAIPLAVFVGAPVYLEGFAALPLVRGLIDHGMSSGAAMAFMVSGGVVSVWGAMAIAPVLKPQAFLLYLAVALAGSMLAGWSFGLAV